MVGNRILETSLFCWLIIIMPIKDIGTSLWTYIFFSLVSQSKLPTSSHLAMFSLHVVCHFQEVGRPLFLYSIVWTWRFLLDSQMCYTWNTVYYIFLLIPYCLLCCKSKVVWIPCFVITLHIVPEVPWMFI